MAGSNIDIQKFLTDMSEASVAAVQKKFSRSLLWNMLEDSVYADITLQARGGTVKAHRSVLATASPFFREMFLQHEMEVLQPSSVSLPAMTVENLQLFLVLLYIASEETRAMPEFDAAVDTHFTALFDATHEFKVEGRLDAVLKSGLLRHLTPANCWDFYHKCEGFALLSEHDFSEACLSYVVKNCEEVTKSESTLLEKRRDPELVQRCIIEAVSKG